MSTPVSDPEPSRWIGVRRFPDWCRLRQWVARQASLAGPGRAVERLRILVPSAGAAWALDRTLRESLPPGGSFPEIRVSSSAFDDLGGDLEPPLLPAPPLVREILMEEALVAGVVGEDGFELPDSRDPAQLADLFLTFLDEMAADSRVSPGAAPFERFAHRTERRLLEAGETDAGALRLLTLVRWLRRARAHYRRALEDTARGDPGSLRERLMASARTFRLRFAGTRVLAAGEDAIRPADLQLLSSLLPPGAVVWALPEGAPLPAPPRGIAFRRDVEGSEGAPVVSGVQPTLFSGPGPAASSRRTDPPAIFVPATGTDDTPFRVFEATDREAEARLAADLLVRFRDGQERAFRGYHRCAILAQRPHSYLDAVEDALAERGIPLETPIQPSLTRHPWVAAIADVLEFGACPGRISLGLNLLRTPFLSLPDVSEAPAHAADVLAGELLRAGVRDTQEPEELPGIAARLDQTAERLVRAADGLVQAGAETEMGPRAQRMQRQAARLRTAAGTLSRLTALADALRPIRDEDATFGDAVAALIGFLELHFEPPADTSPDVRDAVLQALRQAAGAAPADARAGGGSRFVRRIRRLLNRRTVARGGSGRGVHLIAASDARFGDYDVIVLLGMVDADWPGPRPGNIFFPTHLLDDATRARHSGSRDRETRLLRSLPGLPAGAAAFLRPQLDDGFPVATSALETELTEAVLNATPGHPLLPTPDRDPPAHPAVESLPTTLDRHAPAAAALERPLSPTALDTYAKSPAQFFARYVLRLDEERPLADVPPPTERGELLHAFLERSYAALRDAGLGISESTLEEVLDFFHQEFERFAAARQLPDTDRRIEKAWLFGGNSTPPAMEWFLREEATRGRATLEQVESWIAGDVGGMRVHGQLDRLDRLAGGGRRVVEYKSGRYYEKPLQARLYARLLEAADQVPTAFAIPYFGNRRWIGPEDPPDDAEQDAQVVQIREGLARGDFSLPDEDGAFDFHLVVRRDLPDPAGPATDSGPDEARDAGKEA